MSLRQLTLCRNTIAFLVRLRAPPRRQKEAKNNSKVTARQNAAKAVLKRLNEVDTDGQTLQLMQTSWVTFGEEWLLLSAFREKGGG